MCIICIDLVRDQISANRALKNYSENIDNFDDKHSRRILELISLKRAKKDEEKNTEEKAEADG